MEDIRRKTVKTVLTEGASHAGEIVDVKGWVRTRRATTKRAVRGIERRQHHQQSSDCV